MSAARIVVVGDLLLDVDLWGPSQRAAPDGGNPIVDVTSESARAGGAGLVATLLRADGHEVRLVTAMGADASADRLRALIGDLDLIAAPSGAPTPVKTRLRAGDTTVARIDTGCAAPPPPTVTADQLAALEDADAIVVADYGRGMTADAGIRSALAARVEQLPIVWDPHPRGTAPVRGVAIATPNRSEATGFTGTADVVRAARALLDEWEPQAVAITLGADGVLLHDESAHRLPTRAVDVADGCGAGDRFASALAAALAAGAPVKAAVDRAMEATGEFLAAGGVSALRSPSPQSDPNTSRKERL
jgi:rfaE bifunctional protein kinase chain/domain